MQIHMDPRAREFIKEAREAEEVIQMRAKSFFSEFRAFAMRGNVVDLAVGVVIGTAFGKIVSSLVSDIITPPLGVVLGGVDFKSLSVPIPPTSVTLNYGIFLQNIFDFVIIAAALFLVVKLINSAKQRFEREQADAPAAEKPADVRVLEEIRDLLKDGR